MKRLFSGGLCVVYNRLYWFFSGCSLLFSPFCSCRQAKESDNGLSTGIPFRSLVLVTQSQSYQRELKEFWKVRKSSLSQALDIEKWEPIWVGLEKGKERKKSCWIFRKLGFSGNWIFPYRELIQDSVCVAIKIKVQQIYQRRSKAWWNID